MSHLFTVPELRKNYSDPLKMALRRVMKARFFDTLIEQPSPFGDDLPQTSLRVLGSTILYLANMRGGLKFPMGEDYETEDIDIDVYSPLAQEIRGFEEKADKKLSDIIDNTITATGYQRAAPNNNNGIHSNTIIIYQDFSPQDIKRFISNTSKYDIPDETVRVLLEIQAVPTNAVSTLLSPQQKYFPNSGVPILLEPFETYMARRISRSINHSQFRMLYDKTGYQFRLADIIHFYTASISVPKLMDLSSSSESSKSQIDLLRLLTVVNLTLMQKTLEDIDIRNFDVNEENIEAFRASAKRNISYKSRLNDVLIIDILSTFSDGILNIFPKAEVDIGKKNRFNPLGFDENEMTFHESAQGYFRTARGEVIPLKGGQYGETEIRTDLLKKSFPGVFDKYPELDNNITNAPELIAIKSELVHSFH